MNVENDIRTSQIQHVVIAFHHAFDVGKSLTSEVLLRQSILLNHGTHGSVEYEYLLLNEFF